VSKIRVMVTGASGMLGHKVTQVLAQDGRFEVTALVRMFHQCDTVQHLPGMSVTDVYWIHEVDAHDYDAIIFEREPEFVINCAGVIKPRCVTGDPRELVRVNSILPHDLSQASNRLIHVSTDCVFSGLHGQYTEDSPTDPLDHYGMSKALGEVVDQHNTLTLRTSIIGREVFNRYSLLEWVLSQKGKQVNGYVRALYSGVTTNELARIIKLVILEHPDLHGLYQVAGPEINKWHLLGVISRHFDLDLRVKPDESVLCDRTMVDDRFRQATGIDKPSWDDMLAQVAEETEDYRELSES